MEEEDIHKMARRIRDNVMPSTKQQAETLVRTSYGAVAQESRWESMQDMDDVLQGAQWTSTLDTRTTPICMARDGLLYDLTTREPIGHDLPILGGAGNAHWGCRSTWSPMTKGWDELLGIDGIDKDMPESRRRSMDGTVPDSMNYEQWLKGQPEKVQIEALGRKRHKLWKEGKIKSFRELTTQDGRPLTVKQLDKK